MGCCWRAAAATTACGSRRGAAGVIALTPPAARLHEVCRPLHSVGSPLHISPSLPIMPTYDNVHDARLTHRPPPPHRLAFFDVLRRQSACSRSSPLAPTCQRCTPQPPQPLCSPNLNSLMPHSPEFRSAHLSAAGASAWQRACLRCTRQPPQPPCSPNLKSPNLHISPSPPHLHLPFAFHADINACTPSMHA